MSAKIYRTCFQEEASSAKFAHMWKTKKNKKRKNRASAVTTGCQCLARDANLGVCVYHIAGATYSFTAAIHILLQCITNLFKLTYSNDI